MPKSVIQVLIDPDVLAEIHQIAASESISRSAVARRLIMRGLSR